MARALFAAADNTPNDRSANYVMALPVRRLNLGLNAAFESTRRSLQAILAVV